MDEHSNTALEFSDQAEYRQYLMDAPIADFAKFAGIDIDEAVKRRVAAAVEAAPPKLEVTARPIEPKGNLYGFASVKIGGVTIDDFKIVADKDGFLFVGMPSKPDKGSKTGYRNTVHIDKDMRDDFSETILHAHHEAVGLLMERAEKIRSEPEAPPRMAEQVEKAAKEAAAHNAAQPPKARNGQKREAGRE
jgi:DNA-binding cell septation regulator SpoVG